MSYSAVREELKRGLHELRGGSATPSRLALAVAVGLFVGSLPIFGCHLPILLGLCLYLQFDGAVAYLAANVSNPFVAPALLTLEVEVGAYVKTGHWLPPPRQVVVSDVGRFAADLFVGAPIVALGLAVAGGAITLGVAAAVARVRPSRVRRRYQLPADAPPWVHAVERVAARYATPNAPTPRERTRFHYVRTKLLGDPAAHLVADIAGDAPGALGEVLDVGAGRGQLSLLLLELGRATACVGFDWDEAKIAEARAAAARAPALAASFERADLRDAAVGAADTVLLVDVLHYVDLPAQDAALEAAARAVRPGGRVVVREADTERGLRSLATWVEERVFTLATWNRGERVCLRPAREIVAELERRGLACDVRPAWGRTPFSNVLIVGRRPAEGLDRSICP
ncbi:MAG TPA: DUF2062 domain-containing protein [Byssovorax sp.]